MPSAEDKQWARQFFNATESVNHTMNVIKGYNEIATVSLQVLLANTYRDFLQDITGMHVDTLEKFI